MNTIQALEKDVLAQVQALSLFEPQNRLSDVQQRNSIFCGSGDSFAASLLGQVYSNFKVRAFDPLDLVKNKNLLENQTAFIVSISGKTKANINVAKITKKSIAITSNPNSKLAKACSDVIELKFPNSDVFTSGTISFLESALTCISLVMDFKIKNHAKIFKEASTQASRTKYTKRIFFLGNLCTYPLTMYAAAKVYEILGLTAYYERIEQFSHMELFSVKKDDTVIIFEEKNKHNQQLIKNLKKLGLKIYQPVFLHKDKISQFLFYTFFSQLVPLYLAKQRKQKEVYFMDAKQLKNASDEMIY